MKYIKIDAAEKSAKLARFGNWLDEQVKAKGWLQKTRAARELGVYDSQYHYWVHGQQKPKKESVTKIAAGLGVSVETVMEQLNAPVEGFAEEQAAQAEAARTWAREQARAMQEKALAPIRVFYFAPPFAPEAAPKVAPEVCDASESLREVCKAAEALYLRLGRIAERLRVQKARESDDDDGEGLGVMI